MDAVQSFDVREAASTVRGAIDHGVDVARSGITTGVEWAGRQTEKRLAGDLSAVASPTSGPLPIKTITDTFGGTFQKVSGMSEIGSILSRSGDGARGIVYGADNVRGFGHVWNVRIDEGMMRCLDSQPGARAGLGVGNFDHSTGFPFLLTHAGK